jgi:spore protease
LVLCLGNRRVTADAIGPLCAERIIATRHLEHLHPRLLKEFGGFKLSALTPGVSGETGIEALDLVLGAVKAAKPQVVLAIDALAARDTERLGTSVQLTDTGISPGLGIGNRRKAISEKTLGIPVISLGVPTVAHSATLIRDALERSGVRLNDASIEAALSTGGDLFVTPRDCDSTVASMSDIISRAVNLAFLGFQRL